jgi:hypothetical protein
MCRHHRHDHAGCGGCGTVAVCAGQSRHPTVAGEWCSRFRPEHCGRSLDRLGRQCRLDPIRRVQGTHRSKPLHISLQYKDILLITLSVLVLGSAIAPIQVLGEYDRRSSSGSDLCRVHRRPDGTDFLPAYWGFTRFPGHCSGLTPGVNANAMLVRAVMLVPETCGCYPGLWLVGDSA